jgi:hypothetical protein
MAVEILLDKGAKVERSRCIDWWHLWQYTPGGINERSYEGGTDVAGQGRRGERSRWI